MRYWCDPCSLCFFKTASETKSVWQMLHLKTSFLEGQETDLRWLVKANLRLNVRKHFLHWKPFFFSWTDSTCLFLSWTLATCFFNAPFSVNLEPHVLHLWGFVFSWTCAKCAFNPFFCPKEAKQMLHIKFFFFSQCFLIN